MEIIVNGESFSCKEGISLEELVVMRGHDKGQIAIEWNGRIIPKDEYETSRINAGDEIEVVTFMGGG